MQIPVFVSCPTVLSDVQAQARKRIIRHLKRYKLDPRALGRSDYPTEAPLREVAAIARHCSGAVILGFEQFRSTRGVVKPGSTSEAPQKGMRSFPSEWNHLEDGILFGLGLPMLIFKEPNVTGGIFDKGVTDVFTHEMPTPGNDGPLGDVFLKWQADVRNNYYHS